MGKIVVVGSGLVGSLAAVYLARLGNEVDVYERKPDLRQSGTASGRSINLTLCERGFRSLDRVGVGDRIRELSIPAYGRMIHAADGTTAFQPYGNKGEAIHSISRNDLNRALLDFAEQEPGVTLHFGCQCHGIDLHRPALRFEETATGRRFVVTPDRLFGADGAFSEVRSRLQRTDRFDYAQQYMSQGYKELRLPAKADGTWALDKNALHIWPRGRVMLIGFANLDGSFTLALHLPYEGEISFASIRSREALEALFTAHFPGILEQAPALPEAFFNHPVTSMITIRCFPWTFEDKVALIGDAARAVVPSYGQGANCGFEDCSVLADCIAGSNGDWRAALSLFQTLRKPNADAIADLALAHFAELHELVGDPEFLLRKRIERRIHELYPERYLPLYSMISFTLLTYVEAMNIEDKQRGLVDRILADVALAPPADDAAFDPLIHALFTS